MWRLFAFTSLLSFLRYLPLSRRNSQSLNDTVTTATDSASTTTTTTTADCSSSTSSTTDSTSSTDSDSTNMEQEAAAFFSLFTIFNPFKRKRQELHYKKDSDNLANRNEDSKKKRKISQADEDSKRKRKINHHDDEDSERKRRIKTTNRNVESKKKPKVNQADKDSKRKRKKNQADDEYSERKKRIKTTSRDETPQETEKPQSVFESNKSNEEEEMKKKKKRKRDEVEREYETGRCGRWLDHKTDKTSVAAVGEKRKKPDDVLDSMVFEEVEGFDDESKLLRTVFVRNFPVQVKKRAILEEFKQFGEIESVLIRIGNAKNPRKRANLPKNFNGASDSVDAYIVFKREEAADGSRGHNMVVFAGNHLRVDRICPPRKKSKAGDARYL